LATEKKKKKKVVGDRAPDPEEQSSKLDWRQFELFAKRAFESMGFDTRTNYRLKRPVMEIDLLASRGCLAFSVDCKHWKRTVGNSTMERVAARQVERSRRLTDDYYRVIPVVLTWRDEMLEILESGVPVVPIHKLEDFLLNWESDERILVISPDPDAPRQTTL
jgi:Holliday junction resolvase-like predicted endonuclease